MKNNARPFRGVHLFYFLFAAWLIAQAALFLIIPKADSFIWINHHRSFFADIVFSIFSSIGNGLAVIVLAIICFFLKKYPLCIGLFSSYIFSGLACNIVKDIFNHPRPSAWPPTHNLVIAPSWITLFQQNSFPSGHSASAFAAAMTLALFLPNKKWIAIVGFIFACLTAYSRVYLGEHFVEDTWFGSFIGVFFAILCFQIQRNIQFGCTQKKNARFEIKKETK